MTQSALVLSGGGPVGIAWESGLIAGLAEAGVDLSEADFILGTSAGSFVGARLAMGAKPAELAAPFLAMEVTPSLESAAPPPPGAGATRPDMGKLIAFMAELSAGKRPAAEIRAEIGAWALSVSTVSEEAFIASFGHSLGDLAPDAWPDRPYACTAVDALDGAFKLWTAADGVGLARAVASSCSVPGIYPPITINSRRYIDGGMRPGSSVDLARGYERVVVIAVYQNPKSRGRDRHAARRRRARGAGGSRRRQRRGVRRDAHGLSPPAGRRRRRSRPGPIGRRHRGARRGVGLNPWSAGMPPAVGPRNSEPPK